MKAGVFVMLGEVAAQSSWLDRVVKAVGWQYKAVASLRIGASPCQ
jgi:hypothetical protein